MDSKKKSFVINTLRRASYRWPGRWTAEKRSKIGRNQYVCESCKGTFKKKETQMDHTEPVVPLDGFKNGEEFDFNEYIDRMFCEESNFSRLCSACHDVKTEKENATRKANKDKKKLAKANKV